MIEWINKLFLKKNQEKLKEHNLKKAKSYAIMALSFWKDSDHTHDIEFNVANENIYVKLGKKEPNEINTGE